MAGNMFRTLRADEIECRIGTVNKEGKGLSLLLYKDARVDMALLDETFGAFGWQRKHELIGDRLCCTVSLWDDKKQQWVSKQDVGTESYTEKVKGECSDAFKRACFNVGIGRELYTAPFIWIANTKCNIEKTNGGAYTCKDKFSVKDIVIDENTRNITSLTILNESTNQVCYSYGYGFKTLETSDKPQKQAIRNQQERNAETNTRVDLINAIKDVCGQKKINLANVYAMAKVKSFGDMDIERLKKCLKYVTSC